MDALCNASLQLTQPENDGQEETWVMRCDRKAMGHSSLHESIEGYAWYATPSDAETAAERKERA